MATRGFRRALIAVAATILYYTTARFGFRQRSAPKPVPPVRTPTVRAPPAQNSTDAPPLKRKKVAVFYNVYARPRPHNQSCTSSKTWHKAGEPDKNCAWIGSSNNKQVTARRCRTASRIAAEVCGCECANVTTDLGAFRRWARRRGKGAPRRDSGATYCGQRPGYMVPRPRQREAVSPGRLVQVNCTAS